MSSAELQGRSESYPLHDGLFFVSAFISIQGERHEAVHATPVGSSAIVLSLFSADNPEILVKVLDGRAINGHWWVQIAAVTQMAMELTVTETATGRANTYRSAEGPFTPTVDFQAFGSSRE